MDMSSKTSPKSVAKKIISTGIEIEGRPVYFTTGLKNPLSGFFFKTTNGKKNKVLLKNVTNIQSKSVLMNMLKKHDSKTITPPAGKILNPLTGRFIKAPADKSIPKTTSEKTIKNYLKTPISKQNEAGPSKESINLQYENFFNLSKNVRKDMSKYLKKDDEIMKFHIGINEYPNWYIIAEAHKYIKKNE